METPKSIHPHSQLVIVPWLLTVTVSLVAVYVWGSSLGWHFAGRSIYQIFPVLGLLAFSIMWSHYITGFLTNTWLKGINMGRYFLWTSYVVLAAILLHPGLLAYQRFHDGYGLPPGSELSYVAHGMTWIVVLGFVSLFMFLAFEFHRWFSDKRWWFVVQRMSDFAMLAIFYHGLRLGTQTHISWFREIWWFYGITLFIAIVYGYVLSFRKRHSI